MEPLYWMVLRLLLQRQAVQQDSMKNKEWVVQLTLTDEGAKAFADATSAQCWKTDLDRL